MGCTSSTSGTVLEPARPPSVLKSSGESFEVLNEKVLPGKYSTERTMGKTQLNISDTDRLEEIAVVSLWSDAREYCYTDGIHNHNNYKVQRGQMAGAIAFKVFPPEIKAKKELLSHHALAFRPIEKASYKLMMLTQGKTQQLANLKAGDLKLNEFNLCRQAMVSLLTSPVTYYFVRQA